MENGSNHRSGSLCAECPLRRTCAAICAYVEPFLPSMEAGRVDREDLERLYQGRIMAHALLDNLHLLTERQQQIVQLYYRESLQQKDIAEALNITQQAVGDALVRAKSAVGNHLKRYYTFL